MAITYPPGNTLQVLSALESLTSVFGMGTGGSFLPSSPLWLYIAKISFRYTYVFAALFTLSCVVLRARLLVKRRFTTT